MRRRTASVFIFSLLIVLSNFAVISQASLNQIGVAYASGPDSGSPRMQSNYGSFASETGSLGTATVYTSSGKVETIQTPSSGFLSTLSVGNRSTIFINDLRSGDKVDMLLSNLTLLSEGDYIKNGRIRVIALVGDKIRANTYSIGPFKTAEVEDFKASLTAYNATLQIVSSELPFAILEVPYRYVFDVAQLEDVGHVFLDRQFRVCLNESVPIVKPVAEWQAIEQSYGQAINGSDIRIAILDTGIDKNHPDLEGKVVLETSFTGEFPTDGFGHGTHCASIAAGTGAASNGTFQGVASAALLLNGKVLSNDGSGWEDWIIAGVEWAVANSADVISMSLGSNDYNDGNDPLSLALDWASDHGVVCVVAAGNAGESGMRTIGSPATSRKAITVGASEKSDIVAYFSSQGLTSDLRLKPDLCAPGRGIVAARANGTSMGTIVNSYYTKASGTSMATPHVAGAAGLILQVHPTWTPLVIKAALMGNAKILNDERLWRQGGGRMDICRAIRTKAVITPPSASFAFLEANAQTSFNFTIINTTPNILYTTYRAEIRCNGGIVPNCSSLNLTFQSLRPNGEIGVSLRVGPARMSYVGWWEIYLNVTMPYSNPPQSIRAPCIAFSGGYLTTRMLDEDRSIEVSSYFICSTYPERKFLECKAGPGSFMLTPGLYSFVAVFPFVSGYADDNYRSCMTERVVDVPFGSTALNFSLADIQKHEIPTTDAHGQYLLVHSYKESISGGPEFNETTGTTTMDWTIETQWTSSEDDVETESRLRPLNRFEKKPITLYSDFNDTTKFSTKFGYYGSNDMCSEVYLLVWKYENQAIPQRLGTSFGDLAKYKIYYDFPEGFPVRLEVASYIDFQPKVANPFSVGHTKHIAPAGINATYYVTPKIAYYRGIYYIEYSMWGGSVWCQRPGQTWRIPTPEPGETGYIHLGDYSFGPYTPGMTLHTTRVGVNSTIDLTGDLWSNLNWPEPWDMFWGDNCTQNLLGEFPPAFNANFTLYVDGLQVANASLVRNGYNRTIFDSRFGFIEYPASKVWNNITLSWNVTGERAKIVMDLPSMTNIKQATYQAEFDATRNSTIEPFFDMSLAPMNYSAGETIILNPQLHDSIEKANVDYSFDSGQTWTTATQNVEGFEIHCQNKRELALRINAEDCNGSKFLYHCSPFAYCRDVNIKVLDHNNGLLLRVTDVEGELLNWGVGSWRFALECQSAGNITYSPILDNCTIRINAPLSGDNITIGFLGIGIYGRSTLTLHRTMGDVNGDLDVDVLDLIAMASRLGSVPDAQNWNSFADTNRDCIINVLDLINCARNLGRTWNQM